ncbi:MAG: hypothetical protein AB1641_31590 [Thermodesulfobacteriota bacterium]
MVRAIVRPAPEDMDLDHDRRRGEGNGQARVRSAGPGSTSSPPVIDPRLTPGTRPRADLPDLVHRVGKNNLPVRIMEWGNDR